MRKLFLFLFAALLCSQGFTQNEENNFSLGVQLRPRAEYRNGAFFPLTDHDDPAGFINNRARISMEYSREKLSLGVSAQHVGIWGQDPPIETNGRFMLNEAWATIAPGGGFFLKLGRQSLAYDDERMLGMSDWNMSGRYHDALKMGFENPKNKLHLTLAFNQNNEKQSGGTYYAPGGQPYKMMQTLWYQYSESRLFHISFLLMNLGLETGSPQKTEVKNFQTLGTNVSIQPNNFQIYGTFYFQTGKTAADRNISAFMGAINASCQINPAWKISVASDYLSGNDGNDIDKYKAFNPLYGTNHKFYGTMDYFYASSFINGLNPGLWDNQAGVSFRASPNVTLALNYHHFQTTTDVYVANAKQSRTLGSEWDFQLTWNVMKDVTLTGGYSAMFGNDAMKAVKGGDPSRWQDWAWLSLNINPKVFITKW